MTIARMVADMDVVVDHLRARLGRERLILLAHSWGTALGTPETGLADLWRLWRGATFSQTHLWPEFARLDLTREVPSLDVPVTFVPGRHDQRTSSQLAARYLDALRAPVKRLVWLEQSAHNAPFEEPERFRAAVLEAVAAAG